MTLTRDLQYALSLKQWSTMGSDWFEHSNALDQTVVLLAQHINSDFVEDLIEVLCETKLVEKAPGGTREYVLSTPGNALEALIAVLPNGEVLAIEIGRRGTLRERAVRVYVEA